MKRSSFLNSALSAEPSHGKVKKTVPLFKDELVAILQVSHRPKVGAQPNASDQGADEALPHR
jgi:hypothetical protein